MLRNAARKQKFFNQKKNFSSSPKYSGCSFQCELCDFKTNCKVSLRKRIEKEHKIIPQLDEHEEYFEQEPDLLVKAMILSNSNECDLKELKEYHIKELEPQYTENLTYIDEKSKKHWHGYMVHRKPPSGICFQIQNSKDFFKKRNSAENISRCCQGVGLLLRNIVAFLPTGCFLQPLVAPCTVPVM